MDSVLGSMHVDESERWLRKGRIPSHLKLPQKGGVCNLSLGFDPRALLQHRGGYWLCNNGSDQSWLTKG